MKILAPLFCLIAMTAICAHAIEAPPKDVPEAARREVLRRGNHVVATGTVRSGLIEKALAPPADDSGKWFVTLIGKPQDAGFESMKAMIRQTRDERLLAWIDVNNSLHSAVHYQEREWNLEGPQKDWLKPLQPLADKYGFPIVLVQPPRNGQFGDPATIVKTLHGVMKAEDLADKLRDSVVTYVRALENPVSLGVRQEDTGGSKAASGTRQEIGVAPPFNVNPAQPVQPKDNPSPNSLPFEFPPSTPKPLTIDQIRQLCPGATNQFVFAVKQSKETDPEMVKLKWQIELESRGPTPLVAPEPDPIADEAVIVQPRRIPPSFPEPADQPQVEPLAQPLIIGVCLGMLAMLLLTYLIGVAVVWYLKNVKSDDDATAEPDTNVATTVSAPPPAQTAPAITPLINKPV